MKTLDERRLQVAKCLRARRVALKAKGICLHCGKVPARPEMTTCTPCATKHAERSRKLWHKTHPESGSRPRIEHKQPKPPRSVEAYVVREAAAETRRDRMFELMAKIDRLRGHSARMEVTR